MSSKSDPANGDVKKKKKLQTKGKGDAKGKRAEVTNQEMKEDAPA